MKWRKPAKSTRDQKLSDLGACDHPSCDAVERFFYVDPALPNKDFIRTIIHESIHGEIYCLDEETVTRAADNIANLLDRCGMIPPDPAE